MNQTQGQTMTARGARDLPGRRGARNSGAAGVALAVIAGSLLLGATAACAGDDREATSPALPGTGLAYERSFLLPAAERAAAFDEVATAAATVAKDGSTSDEKAAARMLAASIARERGDHATAAEEYRRAAEGFGKGSFTDDASFAAFESLVAGGVESRAAEAWNVLTDVFM
jgi:hypothetical protein